MSTDGVSGTREKTCEIVIVFRGVSFPDTIDINYSMVKVKIRRVSPCPVYP